MEHNTIIEYKNKSESCEIMNVIMDLFFYQIAFCIVFSNLANFLGYVGLNKHTIEPWTQLTGETLSYIVFIKNYLNYNKRKLKTDNTLNFKGYILIIILLIGYTLVYDNTIEIFLLKLIKNGWICNGINKQVKNPILCFISTVIMAPIFEEIVYRQVILDELLVKYNYKKAIIISSLIFSIYHLNLVQLVDAFLVGIILAMVYYKSKSLIPCIALHGLNNLYCNIAQFYPNIYKGTFNIIKLSIGIVILVTLAFFLWKRSKKMFMANDS